MTFRFWQPEKQIALDATILSGNWSLRGGGSVGWRGGKNAVLKTENNILSFRCVGKVCVFSNQTQIGKKWDDLEQLQDVTDSTLRRYKNWEGGAEGGGCRRLQDADVQNYRPFNCRVFFLKGGVTASWYNSGLFERLLLDRFHPCQPGE